MMFWEEGKVITVFLVLVHVSNKECPSPPASPQSAPKRATKRERESEREREEEKGDETERERDKRKPLFSSFAPESEAGIQVGREDQEASPGALSTGHRCLQRLASFTLVWLCWQLSPVDRWGP